MPPNAPRRDWHSSMIVPMYSLGVMIVHLTIGSLIVEILPAGQSEYDFAGAIKGAPIDVIAGPATGLPLPFDQTLYVSVDVHGSGEHAGTADLTTHDREGRVHLRLEGAQVTLSRQLNALFQPAPA